MHIWHRYAHAEECFEYHSGSSWGGSLVQDGTTGDFHLFVSEMKAGGLAGWSSQSQCTHAVGRNLSNAFTRTGVALEAWCHGPVILRDHQHAIYLLFHVGRGANASSLLSSSFVHWAVSLDGPWVPGPTNPSGGCMMPSAAFHPNGTLFAVCGNGHTLTWAHSFNGSWSGQRAIAGKPPRWEDPCLWFDRHGHWHILFHVYSLAPFRQHHERYSGHAFSMDGLVWTFSDVEPYGGTVRFADGSVKAFSTRERPQLHFMDASRSVPTGLVTAVSPQPIGPSCDTCSQRACSQCKVTPGRDWTFTLFQPLMASEESKR